MFSRKCPCVIIWSAQTRAPPCGKGTRVPSAGPNSQASPPLRRREGARAPRDAPLSAGGGKRPVQTGASSDPASWSTVSSAARVSDLQVPGGLCLLSLRAFRARSGSLLIQTSCRWGALICEKNQGSQSFLQQGHKGLKKEGTQ